MRTKRYYIFMKRLMDVLLSLLLIMVFSVVILGITLIILIFEGHNPFFCQRRLGQYGKEFTMIKFRSMVVDAENILRSNPALYKQYIENNYKLKEEQDPRITIIGRVIRKNCLDELPQLFNVLSGEMSLVGPRPIVPMELEKYRGQEELFLSVKPGITGYWQVFGRSQVDYPERVEMEIFYIRHCSLWLDCKILAHTIGVLGHY